MKLAILSLALLALSATALRAGDVPFAATEQRQPGKPASNGVALDDLMGQTQTRHIKLWYAAQAGNWGLVDYESDRVADTLRRAADLYANIPMSLVEGGVAPILDMRKAAATRNGKAFTQAYGALTAACNACHMAAGVGFVKIQTPTSLPFTDESFK